MNTEPADLKPNHHPTSPTDGLAGRMVAMALVGVAWWAVHEHAVWREWLRGFVTEGFVETLWVIELSLRVEFLGLALLVLVHPPWLVRLQKLVRHMFALGSLAVLLAVFPFDATRWLGQGSDLGLRLVVAFLGLAQSFVTAQSAGQLIPSEPEHPTT